MNPFCKDHEVPILMLAKKRSYFITRDILRGKPILRRGYSRFWECPKCKKRIRR